jgi:GNAT superfamily N-acetyltransferase
MEFREIADGAGRPIDLELLRAVEPQQRQHRPQIPPDNVGAMKAVLGHTGVGLVALVGDDGAPLALALWRAYRNTAAGHRFYVDDLVTDEAVRSTGAGGRLLAWLEAKARRMGCDVFELDSGTHRTRAHRFYFRHGMHIRSFAFTKSLRD